MIKLLEDIMDFMSSQSKSFTTDKKKIARLTHWQKEEKHTCEEALNSGDGELLVVEEEGQLAGEVEHRVLRMCGNEKSNTKKCRRWQTLSVSWGLTSWSKNPRARTGSEV